MVSAGGVLPREQRNELFAAIKNSAAPVSDFEVGVDPTGSQRAFIIKHRLSQSFFSITPETEGKYLINGALADDDPYSQKMMFIHFMRQIGHTRGGTGRRILESWNSVPGLVIQWADNIADMFSRSAATPDLWAQLEQGRQLGDVPQENTPFTEQERAEIARQIQQIKAYVKTTYELTSDQAAQVERGFDALEQAGSHLGRKDWLTLLIGTVSSLVLTSVLPQTEVQNVLLMTLHGIGHLFGLGGGPPPHLPHGG